MVAALLAGCATDNSVGGGSQIGKVQGIYVEEHNGIFVDRQMAAADASAPLWVYVTFDRPLKDGTRFATAILEQDPGIEAGDLVQLRLTDGEEPRAEGTPARNHVVALIAKHDTTRARAFDSAPTPASEALRQAAADPRP